ncbi:glycosyltransferase [Paenibacillus ihumii]|uniref:glycosyltransferase n=1 Tax=Paenibacillus ihumii TaxID=687436 RepID=UPI0006D80C3D|nr:nucleotide disphospho-sugar-binding domain-containing protein [Paenibacillus ihumii]
MKKKRIFIGMMAGMGRVNRCLPIALMLRDMGHEVAFTIWGNAGAAMEQAGFQAIPIPPIPGPKVQTFDPDFANFHHFLAMMGYADPVYMKNELESRLSATADFKPDLVLTDSSLSAAFIARKLGIPLVSIHQSCSLPGGMPFNPDAAANLAEGGKSGGDDEGDGQEDGKEGSKEGGKESGEGNVVGNEVTAALNETLALHGMGRSDGVLSFLAGDLAIIPSIPEFDPVDPQALSIPLEYVGPVVWRDASAEGLPSSWLERERGLAGRRRVFVYTSRLVEWGVESGGHIFREVVNALGHTSTEILIATGFNPLEGVQGDIPPNVTFAAYVSGVMAAERSDLLIHHGGHGSCMTTLLTGTPSLMIPTWAEREFNARQLQDIGGGCMIRPSEVTGQRLADIVESMLSGGALEQAQKLRDDIAARHYGGAERAAALIHGLL